MAASTLTYSQKMKGWTSRFSYLPEFMVSMNNYLYTFKDGDLWRHRSATANRNNFYGDDNNSIVTPVFNDSPLDAKMFKTISLEGSTSWTAAVTTDLDTGSIDSTYFTLKEGEYYSYIRRVAGNKDLDLMSAQGIGVSTTVVGAAPGAVTINFGFDIGSIVSDGDVAYIGAAGGVTEIGTITAHTSTSITINVAAVTPTQAVDFIMYLKNAEAESYGARGYYMQVQLTNSSTSAVELFAIGTEVFKSYP